MRTFKRILGVLLIFVFGIVVGSALTTAGALQKAQETLLGGPEAVMDVVVKRLDHKLKLDDEQKRKLQGIIDDARIQLRQSHAKIRPEVEQTLHEAEERTRAILYPAQVMIFDEMVSKSREKWKAAEAAPKATPAPQTTPVPTTPAPTEEPK
jgi:excinuclease UvrABC ATPase subunit